MLGETASIRLEGCAIRVAGDSRGGRGSARRGDRAGWLASCRGRRRAGGSAGGEDQRETGACGRDSPARASKA